jgi:hypothetical protein
METSAQEMGHATTRWAAQTGKPTIVQLEPTIVQPEQGVFAPPSPAELAATLH